MSGPLPSIGSAPAPRAASSLKTRPAQAGEARAPSRAHVLAEAQAEDAAEDAQPSNAARMLAMADDMTAVAAQFARRRELERKGASPPDNLDRVLDDEDLPLRVTRLMDIIGTKALSTQDMLRMAMRLFPDESDLFVVLEALRQRTALEQARRHVLDAMLGELMRTVPGRRLRSGVNCGLKARIFGRILQLKPALLRETYRRFLGDDGPVVETYLDWVDGYGHDKRGVVLEFVETALLADMAAVDPGCSLLEFGALLQRMTQVRSLRSADLSFLGVLCHDSRVAGLGVAEADWTRYMIELLQGVLCVEALLGNVSGAAWEEAWHHTAMLLGTLRRAVRQLPPSLFVEDEGFDSLMAEAGRMMDVVYARELRGGRAR